MAAVLVPIALLAAAYFLFFTPSSPDRLGVSSTGGDSGASSSPVPLSGEVDGTWKPSPESVVGYRVRERLAPSRRAATPWAGPAPSPARSP